MSGKIKKTASNRMKHIISEVGPSRSSSERRDAWVRQTTVFSDTGAEEEVDDDDGESAAEDSGVEVESAAATATAAAEDPEVTGMAVNDGGENFTTSSDEFSSKFARLFFACLVSTELMQHTKSNTSSLGIARTLLAEHLCIKTRAFLPRRAYVTPALNTAAATIAATLAVNCGFFTFAEAKMAGNCPGAHGLGLGKWQVISGNSAALEITKDGVSCDFFDFDDDTGDDKPLPKWLEDVKDLIDFANEKNAAGYSPDDWLSPAWVQATRAVLTVSFLAAINRMRFLERYAFPSGLMYETEIGVVMNHYDKTSGFAMDDNTIEGFTNCLRKELPPFCVVSSFVISKSGKRRVVRVKLGMQGFVVSGFPNGAVEQPCSNVLGHLWDTPTSVQMLFNTVNASVAFHAELVEDESKRCHTNVCSGTTFSDIKVMHFVEFDDRAESLRLYLCRPDDHQRRLATRVTHHHHAAVSVAKQPVPVDAPVAVVAE